MDIVEHIAGSAHGVCVPARAIIRNQLEGGEGVPLRTLLRRWQWTVLFAVLSFGVLYYLESRLQAATGVGTVALQSAQTAIDFKRVFAAWIAREHSAAAGFSLGFDYLFMLLYGLSFFYSGIIVREAFAPKKGVLRRLLNYLALVPVAGAVADAVENALEFSMMSNGPTDRLAQMAYSATNAKMICFYVGLALLVVAVAGFFKLRVPKQAEGV
jgi:predicted secreted protein